MRYYLFTWDDNDAGGGLEDLEGSYPSLTEAIASASADHHDAQEIVTEQGGELVAVWKGRHGEEVSS